MRWLENDIMEKGKDRVVTRRCFSQPSQHLIYCQGYNKVVTRL